jgi:hypothetical protein
MGDPMWLVDFHGGLTDAARDALGVASITLVGGTGGGMTAIGGSLPEVTHHYVWAYAPTAGEAISAVQAALEGEGHFARFSARPAEGG